MKLDMTIEDLRTLYKAKERASEAWRKVCHDDDNSDGYNEERKALELLYAKAFSEFVKVEIES